MILYIAVDSDFADSYMIGTNLEGLIDYVNDHSFGEFSYDIYSYDMKDDYDVIDSANIDSVGTYIQTIKTA